jgi:hypothetical protein
MNMTVSEMVDFLATRLKDDAHAGWTISQKLTALNNAQIKLSNMLHPRYLDDLETEKTSATVTTGVCTLSTALATTGSLLRGREGIVKVLVTNGKECIEADVRDIKGFENQFKTPSLSEPYWYYYGKKIYILPTSITTIDIKYLKVPNELLSVFTMAAAGSPSTTTFKGTASQGLNATTDDVYNGAPIYCIGKATYHIVTDYDATGNGGGELFFTVSPAAATNFGADTFRFTNRTFDTLNLTNLEPEINESFHELMLTLAEAECWGMSEEHQDRKIPTLKVAYDEITLLNQRYATPIGVGKKGDSK